MSGGIAWMQGRALTISGVARLSDARSWLIRPQALRKRIEEIAETRVRYGYRRIHVLLRREGWPANVKRVHRLYRLEGLNLRANASAEPNGMGHSRRMQLYPDRIKLYLAPIYLCIWITCLQARYARQIVALPKRISFAHSPVSEPN